MLKRRREPLKEQAHNRCKPINPRQGELVPWAIMLTKVPVSRLSAAQAMALMGARGPSERLWKFWNQWGASDEWQTATPARIFCEVSAKLLGMLLQHWLLLLSCWDDPHRWLVGAAEAHRRSGTDPGAWLDRPSCFEQSSHVDQASSYSRLFHSQAPDAPEYLTSAAQAV